MIKNIFNPTAVRSLVYPAYKMAKTSLLISGMVFSLAACDSSSTSQHESTPNPTRTTTHRITQPRPIVTSVYPTQGPLTGGTPITIFGQNFLPGATVSIENVACTDVTVTPTQITCTTPRSSNPRAAAISIMSPDRESRASIHAGYFHYSNPVPLIPSITSISPNSNPVPLLPSITSISPNQAIAFTGGTRITITGQNFAAHSIVTVGSVPCAIASDTAITDTQIICIAGDPRSAGPTRLRVWNGPRTVDGDYTLGSAESIFFRYPPRPSVTTETYTLPAPIVTSVSPNQVSTFTDGTVLTVMGSHFMPGARVTVGGIPCTIAQETDITDRQITCTTGQPTRSGEMRILVRNPDGQRNQTWVYVSYPLPPPSSDPIALSNPAHPGLGTPIPEPTTPGRAQPYFARAYTGSQAETYRGFLNTRHTNGTIHGANVRIGGEIIDFSSPIFTTPVNEVSPAGFVISDPALITRIRNELTLLVSTRPDLRIIEGPNHLSLSITQAQYNACSESLVDAMVAGAELDSPTVEYDPRRFANEAEPLGPAAQNYLDFIRTTITNRLEALNNSPFARTFTLESHEGRPTVLLRLYSLATDTSGLSIHTRTNHWHHFNALMEAIATNNETSFIENIITLATLFHPSLLEARNGLIEAYSYMFVTKEFPSRESRHHYMHFTLRCGGIY